LAQHALRAEMRKRTQASPRVSAPPTSPACSVRLVRMRSRVCVDEKAHARETGGEKLRHGSSLLSGRRNGEGHCGETEADPATNCQPRF
jgi:hypothetical protein